VDVIVTDGFTGNVILKVSGVPSSDGRGAPARGDRGAEASVGFCCRGRRSEVQTRLDYSEYGGAPLLGVKGCVIICHGRSSAKAVKNAIRLAAEFSRQRLGQKIQSAIADLHAREAQAVQS
jgi:glycerol-3-phosphate acyltransferase PlsX